MERRGQETVAELVTSGDSVCSVVRRHGLSPQQLFGRVADAVNGDPPIPIGRRRLTRGRAKLAHRASADAPSDLAGVGVVVQDLAETAQAQLVDIALHTALPPKQGTRRERVWDFIWDFTSAKGGAVPDDPLAFSKRGGAQIEPKRDFRQQNQRNWVVLKWRSQQDSNLQPAE
jgi:transposase-like protein